MIGLLALRLFQTVVPERLDSALAPMAEGPEEPGRLAPSSVSWALFEAKRAQS